MRTRGFQNNEQRIENATELEKARISYAEQHYAKRPKENIKDLIQHDYQDYSDWRKTPKLITV